MSGRIISRIVVGPNAADWLMSHRLYGVGEIYDLAPEHVNCARVVLTPEVLNALVGLCNANGYAVRDDDPIVYGTQE